MSQSLLLDTLAWDLLVDASGNIAVASDPYALAQDAATAIRLFQSELWYNTTPGVPYFQNILGQTPTLAYLKSQFVAAALTVPGIVSAQAFISQFVDREIHGQIQVVDKNGVISVAAF